MPHTHTHTKKIWTTTNHNNDKTNRNQRKTNRPTMQVVVAKRQHHLLLVLSMVTVLSLKTVRHTLVAFTPPQYLPSTRQTASFTSSSSAIRRMSAASKTHDSDGNGDNNLILVVGSANQDLTSLTDVIPKLGETVMGRTFGTACGGKGANCAVAAASIGRSIGVDVQMTCRVGNDIFGQNLLKNFQKVGVAYNEDETVLQDVESGVASIIVDGKSGDNSIIVTPGANFKLTPEDVQKAIKDAKPAMVVTQLEVLPDVAFEAMKSGKEIANAVTVLNSAPAPEGYTLEENGRNFYDFVDVLILNESELEKLCEQSGATTGTGTASPSAEGESMNEEDLAKFLLIEKGVGKAVIVTLGARGAMIVEKEDDGAEARIKTSIVDAPEDLPARKEPVVNTVGAGDSFCGSLVSYWSTGMSLSSAAGYACGVASMTVRKDGAQSSYPVYNDLPSCLKLDEKFIDTKRLKMSKPSLTFVTGNQKKLEEVRQILNKGGSEIPFEITNKKIDLPELQGDTVEIAKEKCRLASKEVRGPVFTEDTSLCFNALNGLPGPYIKWFLEELGHDGLNRMLDGFQDRSAYAQTIIAFTTGPDDEVHVFDGRTDGTIVQPRGSLDFGWDPVFEPIEGNGKTYAEMTKEDKNEISHRSRSMEKFRTFLVSEHSHEQKDITARDLMSTVS